MQKSASTFAYQLAIDVAQMRSDQTHLQMNLPEDLQPKFTTSLDVTLSGLLDFIAQDEIYVIKTHNPVTWDVKELIQAGRVRGLVSYRNPFDIVISLIDAGERERQKNKNEQREYFSQIECQDDALQLMDVIMSHAKTWLDFDSDQILKIPFPKIAQFPTLVVQEIAAFMGVDVDPGKIVHGYLTHQKPIYEFNVGKENRGERELIFSGDEQLKLEMEQFVRDYCGVAPNRRDESVI